jgi:hypothetical protein
MKDVLPGEVDDFESKDYDFIKFDPRQKSYSTHKQIHGGR